MNTEADEAKAAEEAAAEPARAYARRLPREERRQQLLDATLTVITTSGYDAVTIAAVAREAGVTRPVVYSIFPSLDDLMSELLNRQARRALTQIASNIPVIGEESDPEELAVEGLRRFLTSVAEDPQTWRLILLPPESTPTVLRQRMFTVRKQISVALQQLVQWAVRVRTLPAHTDVEMFTMIVLQMFEEAGRLVLSNPERFPPDRMVRFAETFVEYASPNKRRGHRGDDEKPGDGDDEEEPGE